VEARVGVLEEDVEEEATGTIVSILRGAVVVKVLEAGIKLEPDPELEEPLLEPEPELDPKPEESLFESKPEFDPEDPLLEPELELEEPLFDPVPEAPTPEPGLEELEPGEEPEEELLPDSEPDELEDDPDPDA
jgi:protein TonB